ncbi:hypothetical protein [Streptomyces jumonjinensis]|uniref:Uncharacterized protein n=1 Tax=Streptomyces jumonjinensis TaxID=1945 RepID=A0A646KGM5_STRJU|nr:hypothetical protein [Streptomyces jumonjinensis]MQT01288.1 hypothetical protein [Streptomyces jumonjinensis]
MPQRILDRQKLVLVDGGFDLYDADYEASDSDILRAAIEQTVAGDGYEICVSCLQDQGRVRLTIDAWGEEPSSAPDGAWNGHREMTLACPTGVIVISERTAGASCVDLPYGAGDYSVRVWFWTKGKSKAGSPHQQGRKGAEEYLAQIWPAVGKAADAVTP